MENLNEASSIDSKDSNPFADKNEIRQRSLNESTSESVEPSQAARGSLFMFVSKKDIPRLILASVLVCVSAAGTPVQTVLYGNIFTKLSDFFLGKYESVGAFIGNIRLGCGQIIIVGAVKAVFTFMGIAMWMKFGETQQKRARTTLSTRLFDKSMEWFDTQENLMGQLSQVNRCIEELRNGISEELGMLIQTSATIIALFVTAMYHSWSLTLVVMSTAPILAAIGWFFGKLTYNAAGLENELNAQASKVLDWSLGSGAIVRAFNGKYAEIVKFKKIIDLSARAYYRLAFATAGNAGCFKFMAFMMFVQGFWFGIYMIKLKKLHINQVFTCFTSCLMLGMQVGMISSILASMQKASAATSKIADFITEGSKERADALYPSTCKGDIEFSNVDFKYPTRPDIVLERADFNVQPHKMNFIIGKSGSGKSTVAQLLMKFYEPTNGTIKVDGHDVASLSSKWITNNVTLIQQTPAIFKTSLKNNVALAALNRFSTLDKVPGLLVNEALKFALLDDVVSNLTDGIETEIFQDKLSGGQQQRVSIARAKIRDTPILILDEPMNALDNKNKDLLFDSIRKWRVGKTTIIISHEFAHIDNEDHVVLIDSGRVKNQGAFRDLRLEKLVQQDLSSRALTVTTDSTRKRFSKFDLLKNPAILRDLEKGSTIDATDVVTEPVMGIFSILNFCSGTIGSKPLIALGLFISIVQGCSNPVFSYCFAKLLSTMVNASVGEGVSHELTQWSCIVIGLAVTIGVSQFVSQFILEYTSENWIVNLRQEAFSKINEQDMSFFNSKKNNPAELTALLMNDTRDLRNLVSGFLMLAINLVSMVLVGVVWSIVSGWKLALVGLAFVPLVFAVTGLYGKLLKSSESAYKSSVACLETHVHDSISAIRSILVLGIEMHFKNVFVCDMELITKVGNLRSIHTAVGLALSDLCSACATGTILFYGMSLVANESYTQEQLLEVITLLTFTIASAGGLINQLPQISRGQRAGTYLIQLLKLQPSPTENEGHAIPRGLRGLRGKELVRFERVKFAYPNRPTEYVLKDVSFSISKNEKLAILGESGSGKSTVTSLLLRLYAAGDRSIYFAGTDVNQLDVEWLREKVALVPQFPKFFQGTIHENLLYGLTNTKMKGVEEIYDALKMANIYEFVISLPEGINTTIGEGTNSLISGGQLQRLSIARALLRKPEVLILDECTSSLDPENRRIILEMISNVLCKKHTVVMVTHDREMMKIADRAIVLKNGYMVEHGSYLELTEKQGELERILGAET